MLTLDALKINGDAPDSSISQAENWKKIQEQKDTSSKGSPESGTLNPFTARGIVNSVSSSHICYSIRL